MSLVVMVLRFYRAWNILSLTSFVLIFLSCEIIPSYVNIVRLVGLVVNQRSIRDGDGGDDDDALLNIIRSSC